MKRLLGLLILFFTSITLSQTHYPLSPGNLWEYWDFDMFGYRVRSITDTLMPNGHIYIQLIGGGPGAGYLREDGEKVYEYEAYSGTERLLYDFAAKPGDTIAVIFTTYDTVATTLLSTGPVEVFGKQRTVWTFYERSTTTSMYVFRTFADSIGPTQFQYEPGMNEYLKGAIINGQLYGVVTSIHLTDARSVPTQALLEQNYPNPFNSSTTIRYGMPQKSAVQLTAFNTLGQQVASLVNGDQEAGYHDVQFDGSGLASGVYFYRIVAGSFVETKRLLLIR